jgi:hypothetical protein
MQHLDDVDELVRRTVELRTRSAAARACASEAKALSAELIESVAQTHAAVARAHKQCLDLKARSHPRGWVVMPLHAAKRLRPRRG